jgi:hypothetical protein
VAGKILHKRQSRYLRGHLPALTSHVVARGQLIEKHPATINNIVAETAENGKKISNIKTKYAKIDIKMGISVEFIRLYLKIIN